MSTHSAACSTNCSPVPFPNRERVWAPRCTPECTDRPRLRRQRMPRCLRRSTAWLRRHWHWTRTTAIRQAGRSPSQPALPSAAGPGTALPPRGSREVTLPRPSTPGRPAAEFYSRPPAAARSRKGAGPVRPGRRAGGDPRSKGHPSGTLRRCLTTLPGSPWTSATQPMTRPSACRPILHSCRRPVCRRAPGQVRPDLHPAAGRGDDRPLRSAACWCLRC